MRASITGDGATSQKTPAAVASEPAPAPTGDHKRLDVFIGKWTAVGRSKPSPLDQSVPVSAEVLPVRMYGTHTYEWRPGGFFLVHRWDMHLGSVPFGGMWVMTYDPERRTYPILLFADAGDALVYEATVSGNLWTITGAAQRATIEISGDGSVMTHKWWQRDGADSIPLCDLEVIREGHPARRDEGALRHHLKGI